MSNTVNISAFEGIKSPRGFTLNEGQTLAIEKMKKWWVLMQYYKPYERGDLLVDDRFFGLYGRPGTGKSECVWTFINYLKNLPESRRFKIVVCAPTHQAKGVLIEMARDNGISNVDITTMASFLGMEVKINIDGEEVFEPSSDAVNKFEDIDLLVYDEISMTDAVVWNYIKGHALFPPTLAMGDINQLRPVNGVDKSPIFGELTNSYTLIEPLRYGHQIGTFLDAILESKAFISPHRFDDDESIKILSRDEWFEKLVQEFCSEEAKQNKNHVIALAFTNATVDFINEILHDECWRRKNGYSIKREDMPFNIVPKKGDINALNRAFGYPSPPELEIGQVLVCKRPVSEWNYRAKKRIKIINNGTLVTVEKIREGTDQMFPYWDTTVSWEEVATERDNWETYTSGIKKSTYQCKILKEDYREEFEKIVASLKEEAKDCSFYSKERKKLFREMYETRDTFVHFKKRYAGTIHTSQGGGFRKVFVALHDLLTCRDQGVLKELYYTGSSRAKDELIFCY